MIQGAAAELFKVWAVTVRARCAPLGARIVLCLHDELLVHVPHEQARRCPGWSTAACRRPRGAGPRLRGPLHLRYRDHPQLVGRQGRGLTPASLAAPESPAALASPANPAG